jgi:branched-chain amino acid transport system permease protein
MSGYLLQQLLNGIQLGSIYALIAVGYTMVYGIIKLINFAHADIFMVGAYVGFFLVAFGLGANPGIPPQLWVWMSLMGGYLLFEYIAGRIRPIAALRAPSHSSAPRSLARSIGRGARRAAINAAGLLVCSAALFPTLYFPTLFVFNRLPRPLLFGAATAYVMLICAVLGIVMEKIAYRPLRYRARLSALITALGVSLFLENFCSLDFLFGNQYRAFPEIIEKRNLAYIQSLDIGITNIFLINVIILAVILCAVWFLVEKTLIGKQMRAVAVNKKAAALMGIDIDRIIAVCFAIGPAMAGVSGMLYAANYGVLQSPFLGFFPGIKAFIAAVLGGIGSLPGAVIGALIMGITEVFANSVDSNLGFAAAFVILILILLIKPYGILGKEEIEKV